MVTVSRIADQIRAAVSGVEVRDRVELPVYLGAPAPSASPVADPARWGVDLRTATIPGGTDRLPRSIGDRRHRGALWSHLVTALVEAFQLSARGRKRSGTGIQQITPP